MLAGLLGVASLVVDGGNALLQRRNQQGVADAAALAAVKDLPGDASRPTRRPARTRPPQNSADGSVVDAVVVTRSSTSTCDGGLGATVLAPASVCVVVHSDTTGVFSGLLGIDTFQASARAIAKVSQVTGVGGWLPFGIREGAYDADTPKQVAITPSDQSHNLGGAVNTPAGSDCKFYGGDGISDVIRSARYGGVDACPITIGQPIETQTGVTTGNITNKGFDVRIGNNTDSFSDVFGQDAEGATITHSGLERHRARSRLRGDHPNTASEDRCGRAAQHSSRSLDVRQPSSTARTVRAGCRKTDHGHALNHCSVLSPARHKQWG